jgi:hypothetical protein
MKASAKQAQDKASKALTEAELAKKKAQEEEEAKLAEERAQEEEAQARAEAEAASTDAVAQESLVEEDASVAKADEAIEEIEAVAKQLDETAAGLDVAARDLGMMFAQAGGTAAAGTTAGISTTAIVAGVAVVGVAAAASDSDSSSPAASTGGSGSTSSSTFAAITPLVGAVDVNLTPTSALTSAITQSAVASVSGQASLTNLNRGTTFTNISAPTFVAGVYTAPAGSLNQSIAVSNSTASLGSGAVTINGGDGVDRIAATLTSSPTASITTNDVEVFAVTASSTSVTVNTANFTDVSELWNSASATAVTFGNVDSTGALVGVYKTTANTTVVYADDADVDTQITVAVEAVTSGTITLDTSAVTSETAVETIRISSNGSATNVIAGIAGPASVETLALVGDAGLTLSGIALTGLETLDGSGLKGNLTVNAGTLDATNPAVIGGAGAKNVLTGTVATATVDLDLTRIQSATLTFSADGVVDLTGTTGLQTIALAGGAGFDPGFKGIEAGTKFTAASGLSGNAASSFTYRELSDFNLAVSGTTTTTFGGLTLAGVRNAAISSSSTAATGLGNISVGTSTASVNAVTLTNTAAATVTAGTITSTQSAELVVGVTTSTTSGIINTGAVSSAADLSANISAAKATATVASLASTDGDLVLVSRAVSAGAVVTGSVTAEGDVGITLTGSAATSGGAFSASVGAVTSRQGDIGAVLTAQAAGGGATAQSQVVTGDLTAQEGSIGLSIVSEGGALGSPTGTTDGSVVSVGNIEATDTVNISIVTAAGGAVSVGTTTSANGTFIESTDGSVGISIDNNSSSSRKSEVAVGRSLTRTHTISADENVVLVANNTTNGGIYVGNLNAQFGQAFVNVNSGQDARVVVGNIDSDLDVTVGLTVGRGSLSNLIGDIASDSGDIRLAVNAGRGSSTTVGDLTASTGNVVIDSIKFGTTSVGNSGTVDVAVAQSGVLRIGAVSAQEVGASLTLGTKANAIEVGVDGLLEIQGIQTDADVEVRYVDLAVGATLEVDGATSNSGAVVVSLSPETNGSTIDFADGDIVAATNASVEFLGSTGSRALFKGVSANTGEVSLEITVGQADSGGVGEIAVGAVSATGAAGSVAATLAAGDAASIVVSTIDAEGDVDLSITTGRATGTGNTVGQINTASGDVNLLATVNSSVGAGLSSTLTFAGSTASLGSITLDSSSTVVSGGTLKLGTLVATGTRSDGTGGEITVADIAVGPSGTLETAAVTANANVVLSAALADSATLKSTGAITSNAGSVSIAADNGAGVGSTGATLDVLGITGRNNVSVDFVGGASSKVLVTGDVVSDAGDISLDLAVGTSTNDIQVLGNIEADGIGGEVSIVATAGYGAEIQIASSKSHSITANEAISIDVSTGQVGATNNVGTAGITSALGNVTLRAEVNASAADATTLQFGAVTATSGSVVLTSDSFVAASGELSIGQIQANASGQTVTLGTSKDTISVAENGRFAVGAVSADGAVNLHASLATGTAADATKVDSTSLTSVNAGVTVSVAGPSAGVRENFTTLDTGAVSGRGNVQLSFFGGATSTVTNVGVTSSTGTSSLSYDVGSNSTIVTGAVSGAAGITVDIDGLNSVSVTHSGLTSTAGAISTNYALGTSGSVTTGAISGSGLVDIDATGGANTSIQTLSVKSVTADVDVNISVGVNTSSKADKITLGQIEAIATGKTVDLVLVAGANSEMEIAASSSITADAEITFDITTGAGTANNVGSVTANNGDVDVKVNVRSATASATGLTFGAVIATEGDFNLFSTSQVGTAGSLTFGGITTTGMSGNGRDINIGERTFVGGSVFNAVYDRVLLGENSTLTTGALTAENNIGIYAILAAGANLETNDSGSAAEDVIANNGSVRAVVRGASGVGALGDGNANTHLRIASKDEAGPGVIRAEDSVEIGFVGGLDSSVSLGNIRVLEGPVILNLITENTSGGANQNRILVGKIEATGDTTGAVGGGYVSINAYAGTGSSILIANADTITADHDINFTITVGEGLAAGHASKVGGSGILTNDGDINITASVISSNSSAVAASTLTFGALTTYDGNVEISGDTYLEPQGQLVIGNIISGATSTATAGDVSVGSSSNRVSLAFGGLEIGGTDRTTKFDMGTITADGTISAYFDMGDGAQIDLGNVSSVNESFTVDVNSRNVRVADYVGVGTFSEDGSITIGTIAALTTASLRFWSDATNIASPVMSIGTIGAATVLLQYKGSGSSSFDTNTNIGAITAGAGGFAATLQGSAAVDVSNITSSGVVDINALGLTGGLVALGDTSNDIFRVNAGTNNLTGAAGNDTFLMTGGSNTVTEASGDDTYTVSGSASTITDSLGNDRWTVTTGTNGITDSAGIDVWTVSGGVNTFTETAGNDNWTISGGINNVTETAGDDSYAVSAGTNTLTDNAGGDYWSITGGINTIVDGAGANTFVVNGSLTTITGGTGVDQFSLTATSRVSVDGAGGNDTFTVVSGTNTVNGGADADLITISNGTNLALGGAGADTVVVSGGTNSVDGEAGNDTITLSSGNNSVLGGADDDTIRVTGGTNHSLFGGLGIDTFEVSAGGATITGGIEADRFTVSGGAVTAMDLGSGNDVLVVTGGTFAATLVNNFTAGANSLSTVAAASVVINATSYTVDLSAASTTSTSHGFTVNVTTGGVTGSSGADVFNVSSTAAITGGNGADTFNVSAGTLTISDLGANNLADILVVGAAGAVVATTTGFAATTATVNNATFDDVRITLSAAGNVNLSAVASGNGYDVRGSANADTITGSLSADSLAGAAGADIIVGGGGNDTILGDAGADTLSGGLGSDLFQFASGHSTASSAQSYAAGIAGNIDAGDTLTFGSDVDVITDFASGDTLDIAGAAGTSPTTLIDVVTTTTLTAGVSYVAYGTWNSGSKVFTIGANFTSGDDALLVTTGGATLAASTNVVILTDLTAALAGSVIV